MDSSEKKERYKDRTIILLSAIAAAAVSLTGFCIAGHFPVGDKIYTYGDYYVQIIQFIRLFWRELLTTGDLSYSFSASMGQPTAAIYAYYCLSPCNIFFAFIKDVDTAAYLTMLAKQVLSAASFAIFCRRVLKTKGPATIAFAAFYAQCGYLVVFYSHVNLLDSMYYLPLILLLLYRFVSTGKWGGLCIVYACSFITCFYGGYQTGVFSFMIFILMLWFLHGKTSDKWQKTFAKFCLCVFIAAMISAVATVPAAYQILFGKAVGEFGSDVADPHFWDIFSGIFVGRNYGTYGFTPMIYTGLPVIFLLPKFLRLRSVGAKTKSLFIIPLVFLILAVFVKPLYLLMHAFDMPDGNYFRFAYMISFMLAAMCAWQIEQQDGLPGKTGIILGVVISGGLYVAVAYLQKLYPIGDGHEKMDLFGLEINLFFLILYAVLFWIRKDGKASRLIVLACVGIMLIENIVNVFFSISHEGNGFERRRDYYKLWTEQGEESLKVIDSMEEAEDTVFYRIRYENPQSADNAAFWGYNGIGYFATVEQKELKKLMYCLGYYNSQKSEMQDYGGTELTQALFAQKYRVHGTNPSFEKEEAFSVARNELALPLAYIVDDGITEYHAGSPDPFENQEKLLSTMSGEECHVFIRYNGMPETAIYNVEDAWFEKGKGWVIKDRDIGYGTITMSIPSDRMRGYAYFSQDTLYPYSDAARVISNTDAGMPLRTSNITTPHILDLGKGEKESYAVMMIIDHLSVPFANYMKEYFCYLDENALNMALEHLKAGGVELKTVHGHDLTGICESNGGVLFTSIPYDKGWKIYIDGNRTDSIPLCDGAFLGVDVPEGKHVLEFRYMDVSLRYGGIISIVGIMMLVVISISEGRKQKKVCGE